MEFKRRARSNALPVLRPTTDWLSSRNQLPAARNISEDFFLSTGRRLSHDTTDKMDLISKEVVRLNHEIQIAQELEEQAPLPKRRARRENTADKDKMAEKNLVFDSSRSEMEKLFLASCTPSASDVKLLAMMGPKGEYKLFQDSIRILEYFRHKSHAADRLINPKTSQDEDVGDHQIQELRQKYLSEYDEDDLDTAQPSLGTLDNSLSSQAPAGALTSPLRQTSALRTVVYSDEQDGLPVAKDARKNTRNFSGESRPVFTRHATGRKTSKRGTRRPPVIADTSS